jgi:uncharacterized RDD family membrane protein YckC
MATIANNPGIVHPASFWRRVFAGVFDLVFLMTAASVLLLELIVVVPVATSIGLGAPDSPATEATLWAVLGLLWCGTAVILLPTLYYTLSEGAWGQTPGKALCGIVVVSADGRPLGYGRAFARLLTLPYAVFPAGLGLLWAALPPAKRGWHDRISATRVITVTSSGFTGVC